MPPFWATLIRLSLLGTALALVLALALRLLKGRVSRTAGYYLWLLVLLRLAVPLGVMIPLPAAQAQTAPQATNAAVQSHASPGWALPAAPDAQDTPVGQESAESPQTEQPDRASGSLWRADWVWTGIWALGAAICLGHYLWGYYRFARQVRRAARPAPEGAAALLAQLDPSGRVGLVVSQVPGPLLLGVLRPTIVLPPGVEDGDRLWDILSHELTHARRHDLLYKWAAAGITSLHWFNPAMVLVRRAIARCCELSCDEAVVRDLPLPRRQRYGETLLALSAPPPPGMSLLATTLCEARSRLEERLAAVAKPWRRGPVPLALTALLALALVGCTLIGGAQPTAAPTPTPQPSQSASPADLIQTADLYEVDGCTVAIPSSMADQLLVFPQENSGDGTLISVYERAGYEQEGGEESWIFSLVRWDQVRYEQEYLRTQGALGGMSYFARDEATRKGLSFFARDDRWYYGWAASTAERSPRSDLSNAQVAEESWRALCQALKNAVPSDFIARNGLTPYSDGEWFGRDFIWAGEHHYASYQTADGTTSLTLILSQPARRGKGGIWCVEGWVEHLGPYFNRYYELPETQEETAVAYYARLQAEVDQGHRPGLLDPVQAALEWLQGRGYDPSCGVTLLEGTPGGNVYGRMSALMKQTSTLARVVFVDGEETNRQVRVRPADRYISYGGESMPLVIPVLEARLYSVAQAPAVLEGEGVVYTTHTGDRLIFLSGGLIGIEQEGTCSWYTTTYDYDPTPYQTMLATWQGWEPWAPENRVESEGSNSGPEEPSYRVHPLEDTP